MSDSQSKIDKENAVFKAEQSLKELNEQYRVKESAYRDLVKTNDTKTKEYKEELKKLKNEVSGNRALLKSLKGDVKTNKEVLKNQEKQIDEAVTTGNDHIMDLQYEATNIERIKTNLEYEVASLTQNRDQLITMNRDLTQQFKTLDQKYAEQNKLYQQTLEGLKERIVAANSELTTIQEHSKTILLRLKAKEQELENKELALTT
jgi:chromosome segregation ATPase